MRSLMKSQNSSLRYLWKIGFLKVLFCFYLTFPNVNPPNRRVSPIDTCLCGALPGNDLSSLSSGPPPLSTGRSDGVYIVHTLLKHKGISWGKLMRNHKHFHKTEPKLSSSDSHQTGKSEINCNNVCQNIFGGWGGDDDNNTASDVTSKLQYY